MMRVYVSNSEEDHHLASRIKDWMLLQNYEPVTLNYKIKEQKQGWSHWDKSLGQTLEFCDAVILVLTPEWTNSKWCFSEFTKAYALGKTIFATIEKTLHEPFSEPDILVFDLTQGREEALSQLSIALRETAPQAGTSFDFNLKRHIYPGLHAFEEEDQTIFFGRDNDVRRIIDRLNTRRRQGGARLVALLGASGTGISSLLKAGVIPRLKRDQRNWIVCPVIRPQLKPIEQFARAIAQLFNKPERWRDWYRLFWSNEFKEVAREMAEQLQDRLKRPEAQILLPLDQGEELFSISDPQEAQRFLDILGAIFDDDMPYIGIVALKPDFLAAFQTADQLSHTVEEFSPRLMPLSSIREIISGPGRLTNLDIEEQLVESILQDASREGVLPLIAYTMRYLYDKSVPRDRLTQQDYKDIGTSYNGDTPLGNILAKIAEDVLDAKELSAEHLKNVSYFFTKTLLWQDNDNRHVARPAQFVNLSPEIKEIAKRFIDHGLLTSRNIDETSIIEFSHITLLQYWPRLKKWIEETDPSSPPKKEHKKTKPKVSKPAPPAEKDDDILNLTLEIATNNVQNENKQHKKDKTEKQEKPATKKAQNQSKNIEESQIQNEEVDTKIFAEYMAATNNEDGHLVIGIEDQAQFDILKKLAIALFIALLGILIGLYWPALKKLTRNQQKIRYAHTIEHHKIANTNNITIMKKL
ncbi:MAG: toll/interleukin-1 receptor domain-containing protein [Pseudomonadota bacterium]